MDIPIFEIIEGFQPLNRENLSNLFVEPKFKINIKHLLLLTLEQITLEKAIFEDEPNSKFIFTKESLAMVSEENLFSEKFSKNELLNIFANRNGSLIEIILDLKIFDKIYIISDIQDFEADALNLRQGSSLSFELLENKILKQQLFIKYLIDTKGEIQIKYIDHLQNCLLMDLEKMRLDLDNNHPRFILNVHKWILQKIVSKFNLKKFLYYVYEKSNPFSHNQHQIENLIFLNGDFIDSKILALIMNNYANYPDENQRWLKKIFKSYDFCFTNYHVAKWIRNNYDMYFENYTKIEEFLRYTFHDQKIYNLFVTNNFFIEDLVEYSHLVSFLMRKLTNPVEFDIETDYEEIICLMIEYLLRNRFHSDFNLVARSPEKILFKIKAYDLKKYMNENFLSENFEITLKFQNHDITTTLDELLEATNWDELSDFKRKVKEKIIKIDEILSLNFKSIGEILHSVGFSNGLVECCICFGIGKKDTYIFQSCSHFICKTCIYDYVASLDLQIARQKKKGNCLEIFFEDFNSLKCPKCKSESEGKVTFLKIYM